MLAFTTALFILPVCDIAASAREYILAYVQHCNTISHDIYDCIAQSDNAAEVVDACAYALQTCAPDLDDAEVESLCKQAAQENSLRRAPQGVSPSLQNENILSFRTADVQRVTSPSGASVFINSNLDLGSNSIQTSGTVTGAVETNSISSSGDITLNYDTDGSDSGERFEIQQNGTPVMFIDNTALTASNRNVDIGGQNIANVGTLQADNLNTSGTVTAGSLTLELSSTVDNTGGTLTIEANNNVVLEDDLAPLVADPNFSSSTDDTLHILTIDASGNLGYSSNTIGDISSRRFKRDIQNIQDSDTILASLTPKSFRFIEDKDDGYLHRGFIAEEVEAFAPELVRYDSEGRPNALKYIEIVPLLINSLNKDASDLDALLAYAHDVCALSK